MIKAVVFDFDGLILDTETSWYESFRELYDEHGVELPLELWNKNVGTTNDEFNPYSYLEQSLRKPLDRSDLEARFQHKLRQSIERLDLRPGVVGYLEEAKRLNLKIGLASSSKRSWVERYLNKYQLMPYFNSLHTADDVARVKPDPALYLQALNSLEAAGNEAIAFEDSLHGLHAAKSAGMFCVVVPNPVTCQFPFANHDLLINSMEQLTLGEVIERMSDAR